MFNKIILGTANFVQPYGILSSGASVPREAVTSILNRAVERGIDTLDCAYSYGDILSVAPASTVKKMRIIEKFSVLERPENILRRLTVYGKEYKVYAALIHDPKNLPLVDRDSLLSLFKSLRKNHNIQKIGVSAYDMQDIENLIPLTMPDIIQIPLNPFNQYFNNDSFLAFAQKNSIEIHGRSLFLQGVLLSDTLPKILEPIREKWLEFRKIVSNYPSSLHALLSWGFSLEWIKSWVLGVSSVDDLDGIISAIESRHLNRGAKFMPIDHPLVDPRNWNLS